MLGLVLVITALPGLARAEPGSPRVPQAPEEVYSEDFANTTTTVPVSLGDYVGASPPGQTYTADRDWLNQGCSGSIVRGDLPNLPVAEGCTARSWGRVRQLTWALGKLLGASDSLAFENFALSSFTQASPGPGVVFTTETDLPIDLDSRFLVFSVDAMAINCHQTHPALLFSIVTGATSTPLGEVLDPCSGPFSVIAPDVPGVAGSGPILARGGTFRSSDSFLYDGTSFGLELRNQEGRRAGNDAAIDNIAVVDATPQLDHAFSPDRLPVGDTATLTYTITNTTDLAGKAGWRFANTLPPGLAVAGTPSTTCSGTEVTADVGGRSVEVSNGRLRTGQDFCAVTVPVTADTAKTYANEPADLALRGLDAAAAASVTFTSDSASLSLEIDKITEKPADANDNGITDAGDTISYTFSVDNTGPVPIAAIVVEDKLLEDTAVCDSPSLDPSEDTNCSRTYTLTQDDVDAGKVVNTATASGVAGGDLVSAESNRITIRINSPAKLEITNSAGPPADQNGNGRTDTGDTIDFSYTVSNTGAVTVGEVEVDDELSTKTSCSDTTLAPEEVTTCSGSYAISQDDVDGGSVDNRAAAVGVTPAGASITSSMSDTASTATDETASLSLRETAAGPDDTDKKIRAGDRIRYAFAVGNTGSVTINDITVDDAVLPDAAECGTTSLPPGESTTCAGTYRISQDDVDAGSVTNTATAAGTAPGGGVVTSPEDSVKTLITNGSGLSLAMQAGSPVDVNANRVTDRGDTIFYSFTVRNVGGVSLSKIALTDRRLSGVTCADTSLDPGQTATCLADEDYVITQADMDEGSVVNQATATGEQPDGDSVRSAAATETTPVRVVRAVGLVQRLLPIEDANGTGRDDAGDRISFEFTVVNTGTISLTNVNVRAPLLEDSEVSIACPATGLAPGQTLTCTSGLYVITDDDVTDGSLGSVATVAARTPAGQVRSVPSSVTVLLNESQAPIPDPTTATSPGTEPPPPPAGPQPGGALPTKAPPSLSLWVPALALLLVVPEAVLLIWRHQHNRLAAEAAAALRARPPQISVWMGR